MESLLSKYKIPPVGNTSIGGIKSKGGLFTLYKASSQRLLYTRIFLGPDEADVKLKTSRNAVFPGGAIPHSISSESPAEKMHAHLRSFSFYRKIATKSKSKLYAIFI
jgi:hypothetical protein